MRCEERNSAIAAKVFLEAISNPVRRKILPTGQPQILAGDLAPCTKSRPGQSPTDGAMAEARVGGLAIEFESGLVAVTVSCAHAGIYLN